MSASENPSLTAWAITSRRSGRGSARAARTASRSPPSALPEMVISSRPLRPVSIERMAFCSDSAKLRPIDMASPTDFIEVLSSASVPGNFSKVKRGTLVTT